MIRNNMRMLLTAASLSGAMALATAPANAQTNNNQQTETVPPVEVIQEQTPKPKPPAKKKKAPSSSTFILPENIVEVPSGPTRGTDGRLRTNAKPVTSPVIPNTILPADLSNYAGAASRVTTEILEQNRPRVTNDIISRTPGTHIVNDDGLGRHGGIGIRGGPPRRSRKTLMLEDGAPINMSLWVDPSTHYVPPPDRLEGVEILRGTTIVHGPNNNHGVVNFLNLHPFGSKETVVSGSIGMTDNEGRSAGESASNYGPNNTRHIHTRQQSSSGNIGAVFSYSGAESDGVWDTERLRYNDFYTAVGARDGKNEVVASLVYFRQRDSYDEANLEGEEGDGEGAVEAKFFNEIGHCKTCYDEGSVFNTYNADIWRSQVVHNYSASTDITFSSRVYAYFHRRDRYQNFEGSNPKDDDIDVGISPVLDGDEVLIPEGVMLGRLRTYRHQGAESRAEFANMPFAGGLKQDIQVGVRYEHHTFRNRNFLGVAGEVLEDGDKDGLTIFSTDTQAHAFSTWLQTAIHLAPTVTVTPGVRIEHYRVNRDTFVKSVEEGEAEELEGGVGFGNGDTGDCDVAFGVDVDECFEFEGLNTTAFSENFNRTHVLPGVSMAWTGLNKTTVFGGYHRGVTMHLLREEPFAPGAEIGDNFQVGFRTKAFKGLTLEVAGFYNMIQDFQIKGSTTDAAGNNTFGNADEVRIAGVEVFSRLESKPFTGGDFNFFGEGTYTFSDPIIEKGTKIVRDEATGNITDIINLSGKEVPEVSRHFANLTLGVQHEAGWDLSVTYQYRGAFFTDEVNTAYGGDEEGENGEVPDVWLLNARANVKLPNTNTTLYVAGNNLTDKLYISDREDGIKPGQGMTITGGATIKFN